MCGIFGVFVKPGAEIQPTLLQNIVNSLFKLSESRGKEAAGFAIKTPKTICVYKQPVSASKMLRSSCYEKIMKKFLYKSYNKPISIIGHSRLVTNGTQLFNENNQPVIKDGIIGVHNGIIVNADELFKRYPKIKRRCEVDTEIMLGMIRLFMSDSLIRPVQRTFKEIEGAASTALLFEDYEDSVLATNTGSLYTCTDKKKTIFIFASEKYILNKLIKKYSTLFRDSTEVHHLRAGCGVLIRDRDLKIRQFKLDAPVNLQTMPSPFNAQIKNISPEEDNIKEKPNMNIEPSQKEKKILEYNLYPDLKRCTRCILPETFPFIEFDENGLCNYCRNYRKKDVLGENALKRFVKKYKKKNGIQDCIVAFSGGRDSSFGLHYVKTALDLNPIAYTYDWGMITDLARRNAARMCGSLGVEHLLVSADITKKRANIRKNVEAWLKRPELGMVPLFMAGDKQYFYYMEKVRKQNNLELVVFCENMLEQTDFKLGFCGIHPVFDIKNTYSLSAINKIKLIGYYTKNFILNPSYLNTSLFDTLTAFLAHYIIRHRYINIYKYINWDEDKITQTLIKKYRWECASDTKQTWRIGDGTAAFYNYIYYTMAGFTENDTFRSNQIREGLLKREKALNLVKEENAPRYESLKWYCNTNNLDFLKTIKTINSAPKNPILKKH